MAIIEEGSYPTEPQRTRIKIPTFEKGSDPTQPQKTRVKIPALVSKVPREPIAIDKRIVYKPTAPVPVADTEPYSYHNSVYEPTPRQIYYMQVPPAMNPQYQLMSLDL